MKKAFFRKKYFTIFRIDGGDEPSLADDQAIFFAVSVQIRLEMLKIEIVRCFNHKTVFLFAACSEAVKFNVVRCGPYLQQIFVFTTTIKLYKIDFTVSLNSNSNFGQIQSGKSEDQLCSYPSSCGEYCLAEHSKQSHQITT